jgi:NADH dehydrogenase
VHKRLRREGITLRTAAKVTRCSAGEIEVNGEERIRCETVVWTAGIRAHELAAGLPGPHNRIGQCVVNQCLQLEGHPEVFVVGDCASSTAAPLAPAVVPTAVAQGRLAGGNILRLIRGANLQGYIHEAKGMAVVLGMNYAVLQAGPIRIRGFLAWLAGNAYHLYKLVGFKKQVQVFLDWSLAYLFPRDASMIRRPRSCRFCAANKTTG